MIQSALVIASIGGATIYLWRRFFGKSEKGCEQCGKTNG